MKAPCKCGEPEARHRAIGPAKLLAVPPYPKLGAKSVSNTIVYIAPHSPRNRIVAAMSGFEVVGIVLGSLPLAISALKFANEHYGLITNARKYAREVQSLARQLHTEQVKLQNVCEILLTGLIPPCEIEHMLRDPFGHPWYDIGVNKKVQARLCDAAGVFDTTAGQIKQAMDELQAKLQTGSAREGKVRERPRLGALVG